MQRSGLLLYSSSSSHHDRENSSLPLSKIVIHRQMAFVEFICTRFQKRHVPIGKAGDVRWRIACNVLNPFVSLWVVFQFSAWGRTEDSRLFVRVSLWVLEATYLLCLRVAGLLCFYFMMAHQQDTLRMLCELLAQSAELLPKEWTSSLFLWHLEMGVGPGFVFTEILQINKYLSSSV